MLPLYQCYHCISVIIVVHSCIVHCSNLSITSINIFIINIFIEEKWFQGRDRTIVAEQTRAAVSNSPAKIEERRQQQQQQQSMLNEDNEDNGEETESPIFEFVLNSAAGSKLSITPKDVAMIRDTVRLGCLTECTVDDIWGMLNLPKTTRVITLKEFQLALHRMLTSGSNPRVGIMHLEDDEMEFVSAVLMGVFHSIESLNISAAAAASLPADLAPAGFPSVSVDELVGSFSIFVGSGSKSEKLAAIFDAFDKDQVGLIDQYTLCRYIRCVLASLSHVTVILPGTQGRMNDAAGGKCLLGWWCLFSFQSKLCVY